MRILKYALILLVLLGTAFAAAGFYGAARWRAATDDIRHGMDAARLPPSPARYDEGELARLPPPVQRYFRAVLRPGQPMIAAARVTQSGEFLVDEARGRWGRFSATQLVTPSPPAFDWDARIAMAPGITAFVRDAYVNDEGMLRADAFGLLTLLDQRGTAELASGELMRYLAEATWYPTALLPSQGVRWQAVNATTARATLTRGATSVSLEFHFDTQGLVTLVRSEARYREVKGVSTPMPWQGRIRHYAEREGVRIPLDAEVEWVSAGVARPYFRGHIDAITYDTAR